MEHMQNFGPNDVQNGTLMRMFQHAGIHDVNSFVNDVRGQNMDFVEHETHMTNDHGWGGSGPTPYAQNYASPSNDWNQIQHNAEPLMMRSQNSTDDRGNRFGSYLNTAQKMFANRDGGSGGNSSLSNVKQMYRLWKSLDKNGDGKITVEDIEILLKEMGLGFVSKHLARAIFDIVDTNHNGQLDFRDVLALTAILKRLAATRSAKHQT